MQWICQQESRRGGHQLFSKNILRGRKTQVLTLRQDLHNALGRSISARITQNMNIVKKSSAPRSFGTSWLAFAGQSAAPAPEFWMR